MQGDAFCDLEDEDIRLATDQLILKGAAIYGCPMPTTEGFAEIISSQLVAFLNSFGYGHLTVSEMILAMHMNAAGVFRYNSGDYADRIEFTGNNFNVMFLAKILELYRGLRNALDRKFQNHIDGF